MKTCRGCPHIALDQWPQGKQAVRCLYTGNGDRFGRVLHVVRDGNPHPDNVRTPEWCKKERDGDDNPSVSPTASQLPLHKGAEPAPVAPYEVNHRRQKRHHHRRDKHCFAPAHFVFLSLFLFGQKWNLCAAPRISSSSHSITGSGVPLLV